MKVASLPRNAAEYHAWFDGVVDAVTAAATAPDPAFAWIMQVEVEGTTFDDLYQVTSMTESLDTRLRAGITKHLTGPDAEKSRELVTCLRMKRDELRRASPPRQVRGRQLLWLVRNFYRIQDDVHTSFELSALMDIEYAGDAKLAEFKSRWDFVVRHLRTRLKEADLESILIKKLRGSELLRPHLEYYDRCPRGHEDRSYRWLCQLMDTMIVDQRDKRNTQSLILQASGKEQPPPKASGKVAKGGPDGESKTPKGGGKGKDGDKGGKGGGKGKGADGKKKGDGKGSKKSTGSGSDSEKSGGKATSEIPKDHMCCVSHLWGRCQKADCPYAHRDQPTKGIKEHWLYVKNLKRLGPPTGPKPAAQGAAGDAAS